MQIFAGDLVSFISILSFFPNKNERFSLNFPACLVFVYRQCKWTIENEWFSFGRIFQTRFSLWNEHFVSFIHEKRQEKNEQLFGQRHVMRVFSLIADHRVSEKSHRFTIKRQSCYRPWPARSRRGCRLWEIVQLEWNRSVIEWNQK